MPIPPELASARADFALAGDGDAIRGRRARYVAAPASTPEASSLLRAAAALGLTVVPRGAGRLQHWGNPPDSCDLVVDTRRLDRIVEHVPADFTMTVQAGVRLRDLERALAPARQTVALTAAASTTPITSGSRRTKCSDCWPSASGSGPRSRPPAGHGDAGARLVPADAAGRDADPDPGGGGRQRGRGRDRGIGRGRRPRR